MTDDGGRLERRLRDEGVRGRRTVKGVGGRVSLLSYEGAQG